MRPSAACVTEGHKSPVSLPPLPGPSTVWRGEEYNPANPYSVLPNKKAAVTKTHSKDLIAHHTLCQLFFFFFFPGVSSCLKNTLRRSSRAIKMASSPQISVCTSGEGPHRPQCSIPSFSKAVISRSSPCERAFTKAVMDDSSQSSLLWQEGACCSTEDPAACCLICSRDDMQSARKEPI